MKLTVEKKIEKTISIQPHTHEISEKGLPFKLTIVDTPGYTFFFFVFSCEGFADAVDNQAW